MAFWDERLRRIKQNAPRMLRIFGRVSWRFRISKWFMIALHDPAKICGYQKQAAYFSSPLWPFLVFCLSLAHSSCPPDNHKGHSAESVVFFRRLSEWRLLSSHNLLDGQTFFGKPTWAHRRMSARIASKRWIICTRTVLSFWQPFFSARIPGRWIRQRFGSRSQGRKSRPNPTDCVSVLKLLSNFFSLCILPCVLLCVNIQFDAFKMLFRWVHCAICLLYRPGCSRSRSLFKRWTDRELFAHMSAHWASHWALGQGPELQASSKAICLSTVTQEIAAANEVDRGRRVYHPNEAEAIYCILNN